VSQAPTGAARFSLLSRDDTVLLLIDHQIGLLTGVRDMDVAVLKHNVVGLARAARVLELPVIVTATAPDGMWGPTMPELTDELPGVDVIARTTVNAWDEPRIVGAVEATGRRQLIVAGLSTEVCATFPALSATAAGYEVRVALDASGTFNEAKLAAGLQRLTTAGVVVTDYATAVIEMLRDNADPKAPDLYAALDMPFAVLAGQLHARAGRQTTTTLERAS
jgi:nicotinamidase-related amidase